nr:DUF5813 family protein [Halobacterium bonnevillei]
MTALADEFADHARFESVDGGFEPTTNDWDASVTVADDTVEIEVVVPTLDAATNEPVADASRTAGSTRSTAASATPTASRSPRTWT